MLKRSFDFMSSSIALMLLCPLFMAIAIAIRIDSPGPVFYRGERVGRNGTMFSIYKFRSMVAEAERLGGASTADDDPRITRLGKLLRKFKLDELPQLINVVLGQMSLVGPRPDIKAYVDKHIEAKRPILKVRPGITDWASIWNSDEGEVLAGLEDPDHAYDELILPTKLKLQSIYASNHSFWIDLKILFHTLAKLFLKDWTPSDLVKCPNLTLARIAYLEKWQQLHQIRGKE